MSAGTNPQSSESVEQQSWIRKLFLRPVTVEVAGGLGNQLFSLVAGIYISKRLGVPLKIFVNDVLSSSTVAGKGLSSFRFFSSDSPLIKSISYRPSRMLRLRQRLNNHLRRLGMRREICDSISGYYSPLLVGEDPSIGLVKAGSSVQGYFQSAKYFLEVRDSNGFQGFELKESSAWFTDMLKEVEIAKPISVHIRRGDYLNPENDFIGALSMDYFLEGIRLLKQNYGFNDSEVWIFSNDIPMVKAELGKQIEASVRWVEPPVGSSEAESLLLMAKSRGLVISNSTFSWWSAAIGKPEKVIAPTKWFKAADDPEGLMVPSWQRVESSWL